MRRQVDALSPHRSAHPADALRFVVLCYAPVLGLTSLVWEFLQMPLYRLWETGSPREIAYAVLHCSAGDILIGTSALLLAMIATRSFHPGGASSGAVVAATILMAVGYTMFSEWLNIEVRGSWQYSTLMPVLPGSGTGVVPLLQWVIMPPLALCVASNPWIAGKVALSP